MPPWATGAVQARRAAARTKSAAWATLEGVPHLVVGGVGLPVAEVAGDRAAEQVGGLRHEADAAPQQLLVEVAHVDAVDEDGAAGDVEQPWDEVDERRLAGAGAADDRRRLARADGERDAAEHRRLGARVAERHVAELDRRRVARARDGSRRRRAPMTSCRAPRRCGRPHTAARGASIPTNVAIITAIRICIR